jgi:chromosome segregation ATPase
MAMNRLRGKVNRLAGSAADLDEARATIEELRAITDRQRVRIGDLERELARVSPQVAALEARLETLRDTVERGNLAAGASSDGHVDASSIWAEIQRQQEQVRARITAATRFEERLRRLEDGAT